MSDTPKRYDLEFARPEDLDRTMTEYDEGDWVRYEDYSALERELTALRKEREWRSIETADKYGRSIRAFDPELVDEDFNPDGTAESYWQDDEGWKAPVWCDCREEWETKIIHPTHWLPLPDTHPITEGEG